MIPGTGAVDAGPKRFRDTGTHRTAPPGETLDRAMALAPRLGITRVANLTGLDRLGVPVAAAFRPNSRSLAVFGGKGATLAAAKASAVMEAAEAWHAECVLLPRRRARHAELLEEELDALDPSTLARAADAPAGDPRDAAYDWVEGRDLATGAPRWVPLDAVAADFTVNGMPRSALRATTNGLASGNHVLEAVAHGLAELVERDALALWAARPDAEQDAAALDLGTAPAALRRELLDRFAEAGLLLRAFDATSDVGIAAVVCLVGDAEGGEGGALAELGAGCHPDPAVALARAASEAAQARLTRISGARDDLPAGAWRAQHRAERAEAADSWFRATAGASRSFSFLPDCATDTLAGDIAAMLALLDAAGLRRVTWVDLSRPELGLPVVRVVAPLLEGPPGRSGGGYAPGPRARRVAAARASVPPGARGAAPTADNGAP